MRILISTLFAASAFTGGFGCKDKAADQPGPAAPSSGDTETAELLVKKLAFEGYPVWAAAHPEKSCPDTIGDLLPGVNLKDAKDPWGRPLQMRCGSTLPAGARGLAVLSLGPDGKEGTTDDIQSWK